jgi:hypothetical protein
MTKTLDAHPEAQAAGDPTPPPAQPLILNDAYFELGGTNLRCLVKHLEVAPENKVVTITSFCAETDYPGATKWHLRVTFHQSFDTDATFDALDAAHDNYVATGNPVPFKARPYASRPPASNNPVISGLAIPQPFPYLMGDAGAGAEVAIDWNLTAEPTVDRGVVAVVGAESGQPGYFTPTGATTPPDVAALGGVAANPATAWGPGEYVITADLLAAFWDGAGWAVGKAP